MVLIMVRPTIDLEPYKAEIINLFYQDQSTSDIASTIKAKYHVRVRERTIKSRLSGWGISKRDRTATTNSSLHDRIKVLFFERCLSDAEILRTVRDEGYTQGLVRRTDDSSERQLQEDIATKHLLEAYNEGTIQGYGREFLFAHMRGERLIIPRRRLHNIYRTIAPEAIQQRKNDMQRSRGSYMVPGPDHIWSVGGYMKLEPYGIQIYAAIDAYSRYIIWVYVGIDTRTSVSIVRQYLDAVHERKIICNKICSDHGSETSLLAKAHCYLRRAYEPGIEATECYIFGSSTANQRIEAWWAQLSKSLLFRYHNYFKVLIEVGDFSKDMIPDQIALYAVYMPILRTQVSSYVHTWNQHTIRKQRERPYVISGRPFMNYYHPEHTINHDLLVHEEFLQRLRNPVRGWDMAEYLPAETLEWCQGILLGLGFDPEKPPPVRPDEAEAPFRTIYLGLRERVIAHMLSGAKPGLALSEAPTGAFDWIEQQGSA
ncbi:hypothetical protein BO94DRAFT_560538 [Aspergillus sclerotioniger CBS 115572]|uniref:Uncharacterized protein n=1 Tax=Aspergillus sclerotioniger CBS 115572 TaxID=1450535 RepID=A0A317VCA7_9EURO|nr:hypothetical protein BO94DRAFT_560538 [Aspergillus sclerotioniger CBS 115572]PWY70881.1 hypothetical protein BO94DRAFT_560538 [Aspergillus sclerotioniger CBS 115572]